jgi:hypothetical protein
MSFDPQAKTARASTSEFVVRVRMIAAPDVSDRFLEELTILVEEALTEGAAHVAPGVSAAANFADRMIELDFTVEARSPEEMHHKAGEVVRIALAAIPKRESQPVTFSGSTTLSALAVA